MIVLDCRSKSMSTQREQIMFNSHNLSLLLVHSCILHQEKAIKTKLKSAGTIGCTENIPSTHYWSQSFHTFTHAAFSESLLYLFLKQYIYFY